MKCTNNRRLLCIGIVIAMFMPIFSGCGNLAYSFPYNADYDVESFQIIHTENVSKSSTFATDLCVVTDDILDAAIDSESDNSVAILCDLLENEVLYAEDAHTRIYPASLTKIMTAIVALKYGSFDQVLTASTVVNVTEKGAQLCGVRTGDTMTLSQALNILLIYSANDVAMLIAEEIAGSVDEFVLLMNEEAKAIGATNTHFTNPHGLTDTEHYTTAYDLYLILNEAAKYEKIREIIQQKTYETTYYDKKGQKKKLSVANTNRYFKGDFNLPKGITLLGGKTGSTNAAGHCLMLLVADDSGREYISIVVRSTTSDDLYSKMSDLLAKIVK